jgi:flagellar basal body rod protein FlgC
MTISSMMNIALSGMRTEQNRLATVAGNIAHSGPGATTGAAGETDAEISLANELLTLKASPLVGEEEKSQSWRDSAKS